jgi:hypothetical protein
MATLSRLYDFTRAKLTRDQLNQEFMNFLGFLNAFRVPNPLDSDVDWGGFVSRNFAFKKAWGMVDASKYSSLQNAVDAIDKGFIFLTGDDYDVGAEPVIIDRDDIYLIGTDKGARILKARIALPRSADDYDNSARGNPAVWFKKVRRCGLINVHVDMNDTQGVDIDPFPTAAIQANNCPDFLIQGCKVSRFGDRTFQQSPRGVALATFAALDIRNSDNARVIDNDFEKIRAASIWCGGRDDFQGLDRGTQIITGNRINNSDVGIQIVATNSVTVTSNVLNNISGSGIALGDDTQSPNIRAVNIDISGNSMSNIGINADENIAGIYYLVRNAPLRNIRIVGNQIHRVRGTPDKKGIGIWYVGQSDTWQQGNSNYPDQSQLNITIDDNQLTDIYDEGIRFEFDANDRADGRVRNLSIQNNELKKVSSGPEERSALVVVIASAFGGFDNVVKRGFQGILICDNLIKEGNLISGILMIAPLNTAGVTANQEGDTVASNRIVGGAGGVIDGNQIEANIAENAITLFGDYTVAIGTNSYFGDRPYGSSYTYNREIIRALDDAINVFGE